MSSMALALLTGCGWSQPTWQTYEEHVAAPPAAHTHEAPAPERMARASSSSTVRWTLPEGWSEEAGTGMRLVTFGVMRGGMTGVCTIVRLGGAAGGLEANVRRWLGQLNVPEPPPDEWKAFLERQQPLHAEGGFDGVLVDLTTLGAQTPDAPSMLAGLLNASGATLFVKLTGPRALLNEQQKAFDQLCRSLRFEP